MDVGTKELRKHLSDVLDRVARGEKVIVHRRGRAAAALVPLDSRPRRLPSLAAFRARFHVQGKPLSEEIAAMREDDRL